VDRWNVSRGTAVSEIGVVLAPSEVLARLLKLKVWKSVPSATIPSAAEVMGYAPSEDVLRLELCNIDSWGNRVTINSSKSVTLV
jgi:hypothetical protein